MSTADNYLLLFRQLNSGGGEVASASFTFAIDALEATFTDTSTGATSWLWDFGDGNTSTAQNPVHTYAGHGTRNVQLTINGGADSDTQSVAVNTRFHNQLVANNMGYIFDHQELSGTTAVNTGNAGVNGTYTGVTLAQAGANGTNDAGLYEDITDRIDGFSLGTVTSFTYLIFVKPTGGLLGDPVTLMSATGGGLGSISIAYDGFGSLDVNIVTTAGNAGQLYTSSTLFDSDVYSLVAVRYHHTTGSANVVLSRDGTLETVSYFIDSFPITASNIGTLTTADLRSKFPSNSVVDAIAFTSQYLTDATLTALAEAAFNV